MLGSVTPANPYYPFWQSRDFGGKSAISVLSNCIIRHVSYMFHEYQHLHHKQMLIFFVILLSEKISGGMGSPPTRARNAVDMLCSGVWESPSWIRQKWEHVYCLNFFDLNSKLAANKMPYAMLQILRSNYSAIGKYGAKPRLKRKIKKET